MNTYEEYGKAMIQFEIWQGKVNELKSKIAQEMRVKTQIKEEKKSDKK